MRCIRHPVLIAGLLALVAVGTSGTTQSQERLVRPKLGALEIGATAASQIGALFAEKDRLDDAQRKVSFALLLAARRARSEQLDPNLPVLDIGTPTDAVGRVLVDISARVTPGLTHGIRKLGGEIVHASERYGRVRAYVPLARVDVLAQRSDVRFVEPAIGAITQSHVASAINVSEGDIAHAADFARARFGVDGSGVKACVLSDGVDSLSSLQASGDLPANVTVVPGGGGSGDEGSAMLEIVHDLAPGAELFFATAFTSDASFAENIRSLRFDYGCDVIVDDVFYFNESPFQDGPVIAPAVNDVTEDGALYFSSVGNSGNLNDGTAGVWEGDFVDGASGPNGQARIHDFGAGHGTNQLTKSAPYAVVLHWSDPLGASGNDYELLVLDPTKQNVVAASLNVQDGNDNPFEIVGSVPQGYYLLIAKHNGDADRYLHLNTIRGELEFATDGQAGGHPTAPLAFSVAAVRAQGATEPFDGAESVEPFSSDGPRRVFYEEDGTPITPGNVSSTGGEVRQDPDITAADGVHVAAPGFDPFFGTSAAAPHAAAISALVLSERPMFDSEAMRKVFGRSALDIEGVGVDQDSGLGIVMADAAVALAQGTAPTDFNSDLRSDIFWRNTATGQNAIWYMDGLTRLPESGFTMVQSDTNWQVVGIGDFDADGHYDVLWRNSANGQNGIWLMHGLVATPGLIPSVSGAGWAVEGVGDFDGDGNADILWRNTVNGQNGVWFMDGFTATTAMIPSVPDPNWWIVGLGDFNGDGNADILWRNAVNGQNGIWFMDGVSRNAGLISSVSSAGWSIGGVGDFDGDGKADILWRNTSSGQNGIWLMDGLSASPSMIPSLSGASWQLEVLGDFDGDSKADILWRNIETGENGIWFMDGFAATTGLIPSVSDTMWEIKPD